MFVAQAHSFAQQARLAVTLAWVAGYTNIIALITCATTTSHVSGTVSNLGRDVAEGSWSMAGFAAFVLAAFGLGAALAGFATELGKRRGWESMYVLPMAIEAVLLAGFALGVEFTGPSSEGFSAGRLFMSGAASMAMGVQNATITRISSGVVRTTHMTGILTDLGLEAVQFFWKVFDQRALARSENARQIARRVQADVTARRLALLGAIIVLFGLGAGLGTFAHLYFPRLAMFPPVLFLAWVIYQDVMRPIAEIEPSDLERVARAVLSEHEFSTKLGIYELQKDADRRGAVHRLPNLASWADRLPASISVVVLDLHGVAQLDANAALEIRGVINRFSEQGRRLIVAGIGREQTQQLHEAGVVELLDPQNVCPDVELAAARAINLIHDLHAEQSGK